LKSPTGINRDTHVQDYPSQFMGQILDSSQARGARYLIHMARPRGLEPLFSVKGRLQLTDSALLLRCGALRSEYKVPR
jgi:hypothetical protein